MRVFFIWLTNQFSFYNYVCVTRSVKQFQELMAQYPETKRVGPEIVSGIICVANCPVHQYCGEAQSYIMAVSMRLSDVIKRSISKSSSQVFEITVLVCVVCQLHSPIPILGVQLLQIQYEMKKTKITEQFLARQGTEKSLQ